MSLANNNDIIIPNTIGTITAAAREANDIGKIREDMKIVATIKDESLAKYIRNITIVHPILQSRINGIPLNKLVNPARISSETARTEKQEENGIQQEVARAYESWFRE